MPAASAGATFQQAIGKGKFHGTIAATTPIRADYTNGVLSLQPGEIKGTATDIHFQGRLPINSDAESTLNVQGGVDLEIAQIFDPTLSSSGKMVFDINAQGYRSQPNVEGQIRIVNASFATPDAPVGLSNGNGVLTLRVPKSDTARVRRIEVKSS